MKSLGIFSILFLALGCFFMLYHWPLERNKTLSQHAARIKVSIIYFAAIYVIFLSIFSVFMFGWFIPTYNLPIIFSVFTGVGILAQVVAILVPETQGIPKYIHIAAATVMTFMALLLSILLAFESQFTVTTHLVCVIASILMFGGLCIMGISLLTKSKYIYKHILASQLAYFFVFFFVIIYVTYLG